MMRYIMMALMRCYEAQKQVTYFENGQFTSDACLLVLGKPSLPTVKDVASWVLSVDSSKWFQSKL